MGFIIIANQGWLVIMRLFSRCLLLSIFLCFGGCSSSYNITNEPLKRTHSFSWLNEELAGEVVDIYLNNGTINTVRDVNFAHDSVAWYDLQLSERQSLPLSDITRIRRTNHTRGFFEGFLIGLIGGAGVLYLGLESIDFSFSEGENVHDSVLGDILITTGLLLPPVGITAGAIWGHTYEYIILSDSTILRYNKQNHK
jgi:hypothetical protein